MASQQVLSNQQRVDTENEHNDSSIHLDAPRFATLVVCCRAVYLVYASRGVALGFASAVMTAICVIPLFNFSVEEAAPVSQEEEPEANRSSHIFMEADVDELESMRDEEHSTFGRMIHQVTETWSEDVEELVYVAQVLSENQGLLILLVGGVSSMMMALVAGLDNVDVLKALLLSLTCYGITTLLVARSARRIVNQHISQNGEPKLSSSEISKIIQAIPQENFVPNDQLDGCDLPCIESMLHYRNITSSQKSKAAIEDSECASQDIGMEKKTMIVELQQGRNYNSECCICLSSFVRGERIRVLPNCRHEFHRICIDKWAGTFAANRRQTNCSVKRGRPTCPLCNTCVGEARVCLPAKSSQSRI